MTTIALHNITDQIYTGYVTLYGKTGISGKTGADWDSAPEVAGTLLML